MNEFLRLDVPQSPVDLTDITDPPLLRVHKITVEGLFNLFDHTIPLRYDERVTIIHGPNGVGKTVILGLVHALLTGRLQKFSRIPLRKLEVLLSDGYCLGIRRKNPAAPQDGNGLVGTELYWRDGIGNEEVSEIATAGPDVLRLAQSIESASHYLSRLANDRFHDHRANEEITALEVVQRYADRVPRSLRGKHSKDPEWYAQVQKRVRVFFVEAQRLFRLSSKSDPRYPPYESRELQSTVKHYAQELQKTIRDTLATYASGSQRLDQSFPERLLSGAQGALPPAILKDRIGELESVRARLKRIGLLQEDKADPFNTAALDNIDPARQSVLSLYVEDTWNKLAVFQDLARRTELLLEKVNSKFKNKQIRIAPTGGLLVDGHDGKLLDVELLSSGEQHELVLLYDLLFRVPMNTLVLIDEPELSLHVLWQKRFLPDLLEIVQTTNCDVLMATHSPYVVGDRSDLMVELVPEVDAQ